MTGALSADDGDLRTWDLARFESAAALATQAEKPWNCGLDVAADGEFAISIGTRYRAGDPFDDAQGRLVVWDARRGAALRSKEVEPRFGFDVSVSDDLGVCASAGLGGVRLWKFEDLSPICDLHRNDRHEFCTVATSPDGRWLAAGGRDRPQSYEQSAIVLLWDLRSPSPAPQRLALSNPAGEVFSLAFSHNGRRLAVARGDWDQGNVDVWSLDGDALVWTGGDGSVHWELNVRPLLADSAAP